MNDSNGFRCELVRNSTGYFLVLTGLISIGMGAHLHIDKLVDSGGLLMSAALLAFQARRPDAPPPPNHTQTLQLTESTNGPKGQESTQ